MQVGSPTSQSSVTEANPKLREAAQLSEAVLLSLLFLVQVLGWGSGSLTSTLSHLPDSSPSLQTPIVHHWIMGPWTTKLILPLSTVESETEVPAPNERSAVAQENYPAMSKAWTQ
jgi:hypothetical protein